MLIEHAIGTLQGRQGSFALQHSSMVDRGAQRQNISVVPGAGELSDLICEMTVEVSSGRHAYTFRYGFLE